MPTAPTIYDVARHAHVSHQTVTRFLQGFTGIRPETRQRVELAIQELRYRPNEAAKALRLGRVNRIGVLADRFDQSGPARILSSASAAAHEHGYYLDVVFADGFDARSVAASLEKVLSVQVAGILATAQTGLVLEEVARHSVGVPLVIDSQLGVDGEDSRFNEIAGSAAAEHLLKLGHRRIGYVAGPDIWLVAQERMTGFTARIAEAGATLAWIRHGDWSAKSGYAAWTGLSARERDVTAVGVANDSMAIGLIAAVHADGVRVPEQISVIGTDDLPESGFVRPALTTVKIDFAAEGRLILEALVDKIKGAGDGRPLNLPLPQVIARASTCHVSGPADIR